MELEKGVASTEILASTEGANKPFKADVLKTNKKRWLSIGGVIIAVVIALIIAIVVMNSDQNTSEGAALENETSEGQKGAMPENSDTTEKISGITDETIDNNIVIPKTKERSDIEKTSTEIADNSEKSIDRTAPKTTDDCRTKSCENGGVCSEEKICECPNGFTGTWCEVNINDCEVDSCNNHGQCQDLVNGFNCTCDKGYEGKSCEIDIDECLHNLQPCQNGGICNDEIGKYSCDCSGTGYDGKNCTDVVDECKGNIDQSTPCNDRGKCNNNNGDYTCECEDGFGGNHCQDQLKFGIKEVSMTVPDYSRCGKSNKKAEIQILNDNGGSCTTNGKKYPHDQKIKWNSESLLNDCDDSNIFDPTSRNLGLKIIREDPSKRYCITELKVKLNDPSSTTYKLTMDDDWREYSGPDNNQDPYNLKRQ